MRKIKEKHKEMKTSSIIAIIFIILGIILTIVAIILYEMNVRNNRLQPWWVWALLIAGPVIAIAAGIILAFTFRD